MCGAHAPGRHGSTHVRPQHLRRMPIGIGARVALAAVTAGLLGILSAGCSQSGGGPADEAIAPGNAVPGPAAPTVGAPGTTPRSTAPRPGAAATAPDGSAASGPGASGQAGAPGSGSAGSGSSAPGASAAGSGAGGGGAPSAAAGASGAPGGAAGLVPTALPSAVFVGEACAPERNTGPAPAVNGLTLFCVPGPGGITAGGLGRWATRPPAATQASPQVGGSCQPGDVGRLVRDPGGRPLSCLRDPNGALSWSDVS